jgi:sugar lactone lactonase YvrE
MSGPVTATVGGANATVYAGAAAMAPGFAGLYQLTIQIPATAPDGDALVNATIGGVKSPGGVYLTVQHLGRRRVMKPNQSPDGTDGKQPDPERQEVPEVYAIQRGQSGWTLSRRSLLSAAAAAAAIPKRAGAAACVTGALAHNGLVSCVSISPDGRLLVSGVWDNSLRIWSLPDGTLLKNIAGPWVESVAISSDGRLLAIASDDLSIKLRSLPDGALLNTLTGYSGSAISVAISPDGRLLASGSSDNTITLWSLPDGAPLKILTGHGLPVGAVAISPDGHLLVSGSNDKTIKLWSLPDGNLLPVCLMDPAASPSSVNGATYTKDGVTYSLPCGSPLPSGAVCTCNCVPGTGCTCVNNTGGGCSCDSVTYWYPN